MDVFTIECREGWEQALGEAYASDFYHSHAYHCLSQGMGEGVAHLWVYKEAGYMVALPLLLRPIESVPGTGWQVEGWWDAISVYGYAGAIASHRDLPEPVLRNFRRELAESLHDKRVISVFSRLHPLIPNEGAIAGLGERVYCGRTVSIDLTLTSEEQKQQYRSADRRRIKNLRRRGFAFVHDKEKTFLSEFVALYTETMQRVGAEDRYFFNQAYFEELLDRLAPNAHLCLLLDGSSPVCGGVFIECGGILEYHLGGTRNDYLQFAPAKLLIDEVRSWATFNRFVTLHLGGGLAGREDSLFFFKRGFSDRTHPFFLWRWILNPDIYTAVCQYKAASDACKGLYATSPSFFPRYRSPVAPERALLGYGSDESHRR
jgi:hypothetical protein